MRKLQNDQYKEHWTHEPAHNATNTETDKWVLCVHVRINTTC